MTKFIQGQNIMNSLQKTLFLNGKIIGAETVIERGWLITNGKSIHAFGEGTSNTVNKSDYTKIIDCEGLTVIPGYIDLHTHGAIGSDFVFGTQEEINQMTTFYASHGVTGFLATTYSASPVEINTAISTLGSCIGREAGARILGIHLEGPWLNPARAGAQNQIQIRIASPKEVVPYLDSGLVRLIAVAPEIVENQWLIAECRKRGIAIAAGHTTATYQEMQTAISAGITQVTHCFNAMSGLHHREPGLVGSALLHSELKCELIADNIHVHPEVMKLLVNAKTPSGVILITDSISAAGMPEGIYTLEGQEVICKDSSARLVDGTLAGSTLTMDAALQNLISATGRPLEELWRCSSLNAAEAIHIADHKGKIAAGFDADLVLLDSNLQVQFTMIEGSIRYQR